MTDKHLVPIIRTDYSNDNTFNRIIAEAIAPSKRDGFTANVSLIENREEFDGKFVDDFIGNSSRLNLTEKNSFCFIVDAETIRRAPTHPLLCVELQRFEFDGESSEHTYAMPGNYRSFRLIPSAVGTVENNLSINNTDWEDYENDLDDNGVYIKSYDYYLHAK